MFMARVVEFLFVFAFCASVGWVIELVYRSVKSKKLINPGFLSGPALPLYGTGGLALYILCLPINLVDNLYLRLPVIFVSGAIIMTLIELVGGMIALKCFNMRLWDYSKRKLNFKGLICLRFTIYWGLLCVAFYYFLYNGIHGIAMNALVSYGWVLTIGFYYGVFVIDVVESMNMAVKVKAYSDKIKKTVDIEKLKDLARERMEFGRMNIPKLGIFHHGTIKEFIINEANRIYEKQMAQAQEQAQQALRHPESRI